MAAAHIFHKLVISAHLFMKMTSWGYCVLMYNCSGEPVVRPDISGPLGLIRLWSKFEVVAPTSEEDVRKGGFQEKISHGCSWELDSL